MGCDGGTIPTRDELVRKKKKEEKVSKEDDLNLKWQNCAIAQAPLERPIVACQLGRLFSKESLIEFLLAKTSHPAYNTFSYIKNLKDVKALKLTDNPAYKAGVNKVGVIQGAPFVCPISGIEMNGNYRFLYLLTCGCVMSERVLREIKGESCPGCNVAFTSDDVIMLNGTDEEVEELKAKMQTRKLNQKKRKKVDSDIPNKKQCADANLENGVVNGESSSKPASSSSSSSSSFSSKEKKKPKVSFSASKDDFKNCKVHKPKLVPSV